MNPDTKRFLSVQMMWIGISLAISFALSIFLPFPISLVAIIGVFLTINYYTRRQMSHRMGMRGGVMGSSFLGGMGASKTADYYCISCGFKHRQAACPRCGSKMRRVDF